jgi:hypothetical protein
MACNGTQWAQCVGEGLASFDAQKMNTVIHAESFWVQKATC